MFPHLQFFGQVEKDCCQFFFKFGRSHQYSLIILLISMTVVASGKENLVNGDQRWK